MKKILSALMVIVLLTTLLLPVASAATEPVTVNKVIIAPDGQSMDIILQVSGTAISGVYLDDHQLQVTNMVPLSESDLHTSWVIVIDRQFSNDNSTLKGFISGMVSNFVSENDGVAVVYTDQKVESLGNLETALDHIDKMPPRFDPSKDPQTFYKTIVDAVSFLSASSDTESRAAMLIFSPGNNNNIGGGVSLNNAIDAIENSNIASYAFALAYGSEGDGNSEVRPEYHKLAQHGGIDITCRIAKLSNKANDLIETAQQNEAQWYRLTVDLTAFTEQTTGALKITCGDGSMEFPFALSAEQVELINQTRTVEEDTIYYSFDSFVISDDGTSYAIVDWKNLNEETSVVIPGEIYGKAVTSINSNAFADQTILQNVEIGEGVTSLAENAFANCTALTNVILPETLSDINGNAFSGCAQVVFEVKKDSYAHTYVESAQLNFVVSDETIPDVVDNTLIHGDYTYLVQEDGTLVLQQWNGSTDKVLVSATANQSAVTGIGDNAFSDKTGLTSVTIYNGVASIGANAFARCTVLCDVYLPATLTSIDATAFADCPNVNLIVERDSYAHEYAKTCSLNFTIKGEQLFHAGVLDVISRDGSCFVVGCNTPDAVRVTISGTINGQALTRIDKEAFANHANLEALTIQEGVESIGANAFADCPALKTVTLPKSITSIDDSAFANTSAEFVVHQGSYAEAFVQKMGYANTVLRPDGEFTSGSFTLSSTDSKLSVISWNNSEATSVTVPAMIDNYPVVSIEADAFANKSSLENVTIAEGVQTIGANAFKGCTNLVKVSLPKSLTRIDKSAFSGCPGIVLIVKPDSYAQAFAKDASITCGFPGDVIDGYFILRPVDGGLSIRSWNRTDAKTVYINALVNGQKVVSIDEEAFANKTSLESVIIEEGVKTIGANAFKGCTNLKKVTLPVSLELINPTAFDGCTNPELTFHVEKDCEAYDFCVGKGYSIYSEGSEHVSETNWIPYAAIGGGALLLFLIVVLLLTRRKPIRSEDYNVENLHPTSVPDDPAIISPAFGTQVDDLLVRVRVTLTPVNGAQGEHFDHDMTEELVIGRDPGPDGLKLPDREDYLRISRVHMRLFYENGVMYAQNESRNGSFINSTRLGETACVLHERDRITMGRVDFIVTWHRV